MFVDARLLHAGGNDAHVAGEQARKGADALSRGSLLSGMFGEFPLAAAFHEALCSARVQHVTHLRENHHALVSVTHRAAQAAAACADMDSRNAAEMRGVAPAPSRSAQSPHNRS